LVLDGGDWDLGMGGGSILRFIWVGWEYYVRWRWMDGGDGVVGGVDFCYISLIS
jgi:hypothetical protein